MRRAAPLASLVLFVAVASCANIAGLSDLDEVDHCVGADCAPSAGGGPGAGGAAGHGGAVAGGSGGVGGKGGTSAGGTGGTGGASGKGGAGGGAGGAGGAAGHGGSAGSAGTAGSAGGGKGGAGGGSAGHSGSAGTSGGSGGKAGASGKGGSSGSAGTGGTGGMPCVPKTCEELDATCGTIDDGCNHTVACGTPPSSAGGAGGAGGNGGSAGSGGKAGSGGAMVVGGACPDPLTCGGDPSFPTNCGCTPGQMHCQGDTLQRCTADGQVFVDVSTCQPGMCSGSSCGKCVVGDKECQGNQPGTCQSDGGSGTMFVSMGSACGTDLCNPTSGVCNTCIPGSLLCVGSVLNRCTDGKSQKQIEACMTAGLCQASVHTGKCLQPVCNTGDRICVTEGTTTTLRECNMGRTGFDVKDTCASAALCDIGNTMCTPPTCLPGVKQCVGSDLQTCNKDQTGFDTTTCVAPTPACDSMSNACVDRGPPMVAVGPDSANPLFWMDATEITTAEFSAFLLAITNGAPPPKQPAECGWNTAFWDGSTLAKDQTPMVNVDWCDAWSYCSWTGKHLCGAVGGAAQPAASITDYATDEWTRACEGDLQLLYMYGPAYMTAACNEHASGPVMLVPVQSMNACQASGIYDLIGNAGEWEDGCSGVTGMSDACPFRGGAFDTPMDGTQANCKTAVTVTRSTKSPHIGFRCCAE